MFDVGVRAFDLVPDMYSNGTWNTGYVANFQRDILPIMQRISQYQWVANVQPMMAFASNVFDYTDNSAANAANRQNYFSYFRQSDGQPPQLGEQHQHHEIYGPGQHAAVLAGAVGQWEFRERPGLRAVPGAPARCGQRRQLRGPAHVPRHRVPAARPYAQPRRVRGRRLRAGRPDQAHGVPVAGRFFPVHGAVHQLHEPGHKQSEEPGRHHRAAAADLLFVLVAAAKPLGCAGGRVYGRWPGRHARARRPADELRPRHQQLHANGAVLPKRADADGVCGGKSLPGNRGHGGHQRAAPVGHAQPPLAPMAYDIEADVLIVGGGPGGAAAALGLLAYSPAKVVVVERSAFDTCRTGEQVNASLFDLLAYLKIEKSQFADGSFVQSYTSLAAWGSEQLAARYSIFSTAEESYQLNREEFDLRLLREAVERGATRGPAAGHHARAARPTGGRGSISAFQCGAGAPAAHGAGNRGRRLVVLLDLAQPADDRDVVYGCGYY
nr:hypothetical protein [Tanacetum cinerariifolium]